ncbi:MAG: nucleoside triphosphate pyrophosphohydrolase, partial [Rhizobiales bacterium]|nr:nucleoside triphosphate pyrophosphohydrolase [Hyphomicrobiales bacterium]
GLTRAIKLQAKAAKVGFDWPDISHVYDKLAEELDELKSASPDKMAEEFGDLLFVVANLARHLDIDPEAALRAANAKFERRFRYIEQELEKEGRKPTDSDLIEMDRLWDEAKAQGR